MTVTPFDCASAERLAQVLASDPAVPYRAYRDRIGHRPFDHWATERSARLLCNATGAFETATGAVAWKTLPWDSEMFGFPAARIDVLAVSGGYSEARENASFLVQRVVAAASAEQIRHLVTRIDSSSLAHAHALADHGFELIDGIQTFALDLRSRPSSGEHPADNTRLATLADAGPIAEIARTSFVYDRFHNDVFIGVEAADRLHEAWAHNSLIGEAADAVLVAAETPETIDAFVTIKIDSDSAAALGTRFASIPLVATSKHARGKGAARRATEAAIAWCQTQQVDIVEVGTQISNVPAARLYQGAGFRTTAISLTYRKWID